MTALPTSEDFRQHERVLWRVLMSLSKSGFFVPLEDARDLLHDFYAEAWEGLVARHDPSVANFNTYIAAAFHRFARRRVVQLDQWRRKLVHLEDADALRSAVLDPSAALERKQEVRALQSALSSLSGLERTLLLEHFGEDRHSERELAARHDLTRYAVRSTLASALERVSEQVRRGWRRDGLRTPPSDRALPHGVATDVPVERERSWKFSDGAFSGATRNTGYLGKEGANMNERDQEAIRRALLSGDEAAFRYLEANAVRLRAELSESDDFEIGVPELEALRHHGQHLVRFYEVLLPDDDSVEVSEVELAIEAERADSAVEVGEAFDLMAAGLPRHLVDWERWFGQFRVDPHYVEYLSNQPAVRYGGHHAWELTRYGMTPETVAGAMRGMQLLFDEQEIPGRRRRASPGEESLLLVVGGHETELALGQLLAQVSTGPFMPPIPGAAHSFLNWALSLLRERPYCVPNYAFDLETYGRLAAVAIPEWDRLEQPDLRAMWVRPAPESREVPAYAY